MKTVVALWLIDRVGALDAVVIMALAALAGAFLAFAIGLMIIKRRGGRL